MTAYRVPGKIPGGTLLSRSLNPGGRGRIRTFVARKERQIYSLLVLATHPPVPETSAGIPKSYPRKLQGHLQLVLCLTAMSLNGRALRAKHKMDSCPKTPALSCYLAGNRPASLPLLISGGPGGGI